VLEREAHRATLEHGIALRFGAQRSHCGSLHVEEEIRIAGPLVGADRSERIDEVLDEPADRRRHLALPGEALVRLRQPNLTAGVARATA
jgi:hypothetical protein